MLGSPGINPEDYRDEIEHAEVARVNAGLRLSGKPLADFTPGRYDS